MATRAPITHFELDPGRLAVIAECANDYDIGVGTEAEWPNNILSRRAVVYGSGRISKTGEEIVSHAVDPDELELCRRLSSEVASLMAGTEGTVVGMGSESDDEFKAFFIAGNTEAVPDAIGEAMIWERFGGTIFPPAKVTVEPLVEEGTVWWSEVTFCEDTRTDVYLAPWRRMIDWFKGRSEFKATAFVRIGDATDMWRVPETEWPAGTEMTGSVLPRLSLGLTHSGSLVGLFGWCVQT